MTWKRDRRAGRRDSRPACSRSASSPSSGSASPSGTRLEWILADLAIMCAGGATTTVYPSTTAEDVAYILADSECRVVFAEDDDAGRQARASASRAAAPRQGRDLRRHRRRRLGDRARRPREARRRATSPSTPTSVDERDRRRSRPDQLATLIYTSGTTGRPKGVRLLHTRPGPTRARPIQAAEHPRRGRPAVPVAADGALVRQGAARGAARMSASPPPSTAASTRSSTTSRSCKPDLHGRGAAHLREGLRPDRHHAGRRGRR